MHDQIAEDAEITTDTLHLLKVQFVSRQNTIQTLGNKHWLMHHEQAIKDMFPTEWTHCMQINHFMIGAKLQVLGLDWKSETELIMTITALAADGFVLTDGRLMKSNPFPIFSNETRH